MIMALSTPMIKKTILITVHYLVKTIMTLTTIQQPINQPTTLTTMTTQLN
jgi:hypothetical protein